MTELFDIEMQGRELKAIKCYDYKNQAWIIDGVYVSCAHPPDMNCHCYGKVHAGEPAVITEHCR